MLATKETRSLFPSPGPNPPGVVVNFGRTFDSCFEELLDFGQNLVVANAVPGQKTKDLDYMGRLFDVSLLALLYRRANQSRKPFN